MCGLHIEVVRVRLEMHDDSGLVGGLGPDVGVVHLEARFEVEHQPILILTVISLFVQQVQDTATHWRPI